MSAKSGREGRIRSSSMWPPRCRDWTPTRPSVAPAAGNAIVNDGGFW